MKTIDKKFITGKELDKLGSVDVASNTKNLIYVQIEQEIYALHPLNNKTERYKIEFHYGVKYKK